MYVPLIFETLFPAFCDPALKSGLRIFRNPDSVCNSLSIKRCANPFLADSAGLALTKIQTSLSF